MQRAVGVDRIAAHVGGERLSRAEVMQDRRGEVDRGDQAALVGRREVSVIGVDGPVCWACPPGESPAAAAHSSSCPPRRARALHDEQQLARGAARTQRAQVRDAGRPAGQVGDDEAMRSGAVPRCERAAWGPTPSETAATRPPRSAAAIDVEGVGPDRSRVSGASGDLCREQAGTQQLGRCFGARARGLPACDRAGAGTDSSATAI